MPPYLYASFCHKELYTSLPRGVGGTRTAMDIREELTTLVVRDSPPSDDESGNRWRLEEGSMYNR